MKKILIIAAVCLSAVIIGVYSYLRTGLPDYTSDISAPGLSAPVTVERNRYAMPTITASTMEDLFFAWGYVNAQDRMFQMEFTRRVGQGRISEFAGEGALEKDIFLRGKTDLDVEYLKKVQTDTRTVLAGTMAEVLKKHVKIGEGEPNLKKAYDLMLAWDGDNRIDSPEASICNTFYVRFAFNTFADELGGDAPPEQRISHAETPVETTNKYEWIRICLHFQ